MQVFEFFPNKFVPTKKLIPASMVQTWFLLSRISMDVHTGFATNSLKKIKVHRKI